MTKTRMSKTEAKPGIPVHVWLWWALSAAGLVLAFTPYRDAAYPVAAVAFFAMFVGFLVGAPKGLSRLPVISVAQMTVMLIVVTITVHMSSWANVWLTAMLMMATLSLCTRYLLFRTMSYTRFLWWEGSLILLAMASYVIGNLAPPDGYTGWLALAVFIPFGLFGLQATLRLQLKMVGQASATLGVGETAPDFTLQSHRDEAVSLSDFRDQRAVLLFFVRGDWCPGCHIVLRSYQNNREKFKAKGVAVLAIGPDPTGVNREMVDALRLEYGLLADDGLGVAKQYGILVEGKQSASPYEAGVPVPTAFLIDKAGVIRFTTASSNGDAILEPEAIFPVLEGLAA